MIVNNTSVTSLVGDEMAMRLKEEDLNGEVLFGVELMEKFTGFYVMLVEC
jgi:hypothetical protein